MHTISKIIMGVMALSLTLPALAASHIEMPQVRTEGGVTYLSGGVGHDEAIAMRKEAKQYSLSMFFSEGKRGEFVSDVHLVVKDKTGKIVFNTVSDGPILLVKLPAGDYFVTADMDGKKLHRTVKISDKSDVRMWLNWPQA